MSASAKMNGFSPPQLTRKTTATSAGPAGRIDPIEAFFGLSLPYFFLAVAAYTIVAFRSWALHWWFSGTPFISFLLLVGANSRDSALSTTTPSHRLPHVAVLFAFYVVLSTSWIAYYLYTALAWPTIFILAVANYPKLQTFLKKTMRKLGREMHFFQDKIACFRLPALKIDVDVMGMMVVAGATLTLSTLTLDAHGIEVAIKLMDGMEIAIRTEKAVVRLGRSIEIGDVYANLKTEMDTGPGSVYALRKATTMDMFTDGDAPETRNVESLGDAVQQAKSVTETQFPADEKMARQAYDDKIKAIHEGSGIHVARMKLLEEEDGKFQTLTAKEKKAMIGSALQTETSIANPPDWSFAVSQLKATTPPWVHKLNNRLPILIRGLLNVIAHLHPVKINGIITTASGLYASGMIQEYVFKQYKDENKDINKIASRMETWLETGNFVIQISKINGLAQVPLTTIYDITAAIKTSTIQIFKIVVSPEDITDPFSGDADDADDDAASVVSTSSQKSSLSSMTIGGMSLKSAATFTIKDKKGIKQEEEKGLGEVARINGVAANFEIPSMLLPHHEYLFPPPPAANAKSNNDIEEVEDDVGIDRTEDDRNEPEDLKDDFDGREPALLPTDTGKDEVIVLCTILASLPAQFNSTILHFATAMLKATKLIEIQKNVKNFNGGADGPLSDDEEPAAPTGHRFSRVSSKLTASVGSKISASVKRTIVAGAMDDAWLAKMVGKVVTKIEGLKGEVGYKMPIPVELPTRRELGLKLGTAKDYSRL